MEIYVTIEVKIKRGSVKGILSRKIVAASISGSIFAIIFGFVFNSLGEGNSQSYLVSTITSIPFYMMYSFPVILVYGVSTSMFVYTYWNMVSMYGAGLGWFFYVAPPLPYVV